MSPRTILSWALPIAVLVAAGCGKAPTTPPPGGGGGDVGWVYRPSGTTGDLMAVSFSDTLDGWAVGQFDVLRSTDGGKTWVRLSQNLQVQSAVFTGCSAPDSLHCCVVSADGSIQWTANAGASWNYKAVGGAKLDAVTFVDSLTGWVCGLRNGAAYVAYTLNGGLTWNDAITTGLHEVNAISFAKPYNFRGVTVGSLGEIAVTVDGGHSWSPATTPTTQELDAVAMSPNSSGVYGVAGGVAGIGGALYSIDYGMTWRVGTLVPSTMVVHSAAMASLGDAWVAGELQGEATVAYSFDGGNSWAPQNVNWSFPLNAICAADRKHAWVVGDHGAIFSTRTGGF